MTNEQRIRSTLFYFCLVIFFTFLPFIISFALGFKFDLRSFKFTKTGLIALKTQPDGAAIYLNGKLLNEKTPATLSELMPARYNLKLELAEHYPWEQGVNVEAGKVTRIEQVILFSQRPDVRQLNKAEISFFWVDENNKEIYYLNEEEGVIFTSDTEGRRFEEIGVLPKNTSLPKTWKVSPDGNKIMGFSAHQITVICSGARDKYICMGLPLALNFNEQRITDVFWHSDSYHLILVTNKDIEVIEARHTPTPVVLINLNTRNTYAFYDWQSNALYFLDSQKAENGELYDNIYKLDLTAKAFSLQGLISPKTKDTQNNSNKGNE